MIKENDIAPDFCLRDQQGRNVCLSNFRGKWVVVFFYRRHFGLICGKTVKAFNDNYERFKKLGCEIIGVGASESELAKSFADFFGVKFPLLSDENLEVAQRYGIIINDPEEKIARCTFLIDPKGVIKKIWVYEDLNNHVEDVLEELRNLAKSELI